MLTIEGGEAFGGDAAQVDRFADLGVRMAALVWNNENGVAHPALSGSGEGLTPLGWDIVSRMRSRHMAVDVSHLNERGFYDLLDGKAPPLASHSCARALCDHPRNLSDHQLRCLFEAGGYVGVNFYPLFLSDDSRADLDRVVDHIAHMCDLGGEAHVGLGSDFDGIETHPEGLRNGRVGMVDYIMDFAGLDVNQVPLLEMMHRAVHHDVHLTLQDEEVLLHHIVVVRLEVLARLELHHGEVAARPLHQVFGTAVTKAGVSLIFIYNIHRILLLCSCTV